MTDDHSTLSSPTSGTSSPLPLANQVGGHPGVQTTPDGSLLIKTSLPLELQFYQTTVSDPAFARLRRYIPKFYGTLKLEGRVEGGEDGLTLGVDGAGGGQVVVGGIDKTGVGEDKDSLVLENLSYAFLKPNILDIKLGTKLYDQFDAPPEKKAKMEKTAKHTTSGETGVRLTGFQVYDNTTGEPIVTPKSYGKSIKPSDLPEGFRRFFPLAATTSHDPTRHHPSLHINIPSTSSHPPNTGLPLATLLPILISLRADVAEIREVLEEIELRMVGGSLLIIYEGDWERAERGVEWMETHVGDEEDEDEDEEGEEGDDEGEGGDDVDMEEEVKGKGERGVNFEDADDEVTEDSPLGSGSGSDSGEEGDDDGSGKKPGPPYTVKLIDFAHTRLCPGMGRDEGLLKGLDTVLRLLDGRI
ncbi:hypothetical protein JAAARDRAFT_33371, partial [Jaapia argillacea MUCL 33604]